ncbi:MAG: beta-phosphoglucomutase family hydrolase [bacterium]
MSTPAYRGAIFDLDGVVTRTAQVHFKAWKKTFEPYVREKTGDKSMSFTYEKDYVPFVDGKPRYKGVKSYLESRGIDIPFGDQDDDPDKETVCGIGNRKNVMFRDTVEKEGVEIYESTVEHIEEMKELGIKTGVASSSKNCRFILEETGLIELFESVVGGIVSKELGLQGKPEPDIFVTAAEEMGLKPDECVMVEDAYAGVQAGKNGNFGLVIGVAREVEPRMLLENGADIAVRDMEEITLDDINKWFETGLEKDNWQLDYHDFVRGKERLRESLTTVGNGYFGTRGCFSTEKAKGDTHYPGTYMAGLFNKIPTRLHGKDIYNNDFVNCPNWLLFEFSIDGDEVVHPLEMEILDYTHRLDMKKGVVFRSVKFRDRKNRITTFGTERFAGMHNPHLAAIRYSIRAENYSGTVTMSSFIDGTVKNDGVARYRKLNSGHLQPVSTESSEGLIRLMVSTTASNVDIFMVAGHKFSKDGELKSEIINKKGFIGESFVSEIKENSTLTLEKIVGISTSLDRDSSDYKDIAVKTVSRTSFNEAQEKHAAEWEKIWNRADIVVKGDRTAQKISRIHSFHLIATASPHSVDIDFSVPARGLHGEAYRGHIFWDELYILPFYFVRFPEIARSLLMYRYRRLDGARKNARENGYEGAMYPWQTADGADEETQVIHYNPNSGEWDPDLSRRQRHVSIAVAYNVWNYWKLTDDTDFMVDYGLEMLIEICRFWTSIAEKSEKDGRYHIKGVMGPDEFHEKYENAENGGITDNAYTNIMVSWLLNTVSDIVSDFRESRIEDIMERIDFSRDELDAWKDVSENINVIMTSQGIMSQFDGYMELKELDFEAYEKKYGDIHRMDRILKAEGSSPDPYKVAKQADTLMTFYVLEPEEVRKILERLGYGIEEESFLKKNYDYYIKRTSHGSTLSFIVHAAILKYLPESRENMWKMFMKALKSDVEDIQGGTTPEGIHTGVMAGTLDIITGNFAGITFHSDKVEIDPSLPEHWRKLAFSLVHRGNRFSVDITEKTITLTGKMKSDEEKEFLIAGNAVVLKGKEVFSMDYRG